MDYAQIAGILAAIFTTAANIPQTYKIIKEKNTEGVSTYTYAILMTGTLCWVIYGVLKSDWPIIIANGITVATCIVILMLNFTSKRVIKNIHDKVMPDNLKKK